MFSAEELVWQSENKENQLNYKLTPLLGVCMREILVQNVSYTFTFSGINIPVFISVIPSKYNIIWTVKPAIEI